MSKKIKDETINICETCNFVLRIGVFFDGTNNNAVNAIMGKMASSHYRDELDDSYKGDITNVYKLHQLYPDTHDRGQLNGEAYIFGNFYIEGAGTNTLKDDVPLGYAAGIGSTGIIAKSEKGASKAFNFVSTYENNKIIRIEIDVFGFSRGAATARHYANLINKFEGVYAPHKIKEMPLGTSINAAGTRQYMVYHKIPVSIKFIGLFDTVPSVIDFPSGDIFPDNDDNGEVITDLPPGIAKDKVVQLAAIHEIRKNFSLKSILANPGTCQSPGIREEGNHLEECMHGVHSDIGGGYVAGPEETDLGTVPGAKEFPINEGKIGNLINESCEEVGKSISPGYLFDRESVTEACTSEGETGRIIETVTRSTNGLSEWEEVQSSHMKRYHVSNTYARIALKKMYEYAIQNKVPFQSNDPQLNAEDSEFLKEEVVLPEELKGIAQKIDNRTPLSSAEQNYLHNDHIHNSYSYERNKGFQPHAPQPTRKRGIFPNIP